MKRLVLALSCLSLLLTAPVTQAEPRPLLQLDGGPAMGTSMAPLIHPMRPLPRPTSSAYAPLPPGTEPRSRNLRGPAYALGGLGLVGLTVGSVFGILALNEKAEAEDHCSDSQRLCDQKGADANARGRTYGAVSLASLAFGSAFLVTSIWMFSKSRRPAQLSASVTGTSARFALRTRF